MSQQNPAFNTVDQIKKYVNLKIDIVLVSISSKLSNAAAYFVFALILGFIFLFISLFLSLSLSTWLAEILGMPGLGNLIVSAIYIIIGILVFIYRKPLILDPISNNIGKMMDVSDLHNDSSVKPNETLDEALIQLKSQLKESEDGIDLNINQIKEYYSFEHMKDRFLKSLVNNPKSLINTLLILREIVLIRKKKK